MTVNKLITLADIYNVPPENLLRTLHPLGTQPLLKQLSRPNATILLTEGPLEEQARYLLPDAPLPEPCPEETTLFSPESSQTVAPYRRGILGTRDLTLDPMIPAGSMVHIDTQKRAIHTRKDWKHEFQRPIYFLMTRNAYVCGWCELDKNSDWLTLIPHPLSPASSRRWRYRKEIENLGRVTAVAIRLAP